MSIELILVIIIFLFIVTYRLKRGESVYKFLNEQINQAYEKYAPYSYKEMRKKIKELGLDYTPRQYMMQFIMFAGVAGIVGYVYFYDLIICAV